jgi:hypothetical protein
MSKATAVASKSIQDQALERLEHIDDVINQTVSGGLPIATFIWGIVGALFVFYYSKQSLTQGQIVAAHSFITLFSLGGAAITFIVAMNLSRQEYLHEWYLYCRNFPSKIGANEIPIKPDPKWQPFKDDDQNRGLEKRRDNRSTNESRTAKSVIKKIACTCNSKNRTRRLICWLGKVAPGYCVIWAGLFMGISVLFLIFGIINWWL